MLLVRSFALWTVLTWALLVGLVSTTPVHCFCGPLQHLGHAVHPLLPHDHQADAQATADQANPALTAAHGELLSLAADVVGLDTTRYGDGHRLVASRFGRPSAGARPAEYLAAPLTDPPRLPLLFS